METTDLAARARLRGPCPAIQLAQPVLRQTAPVAWIQSEPPLGMVGFEDEPAVGIERALGFVAGVAGIGLLPNLYGHSFGTAYLSLRHYES